MVVVVLVVTLAVAVVVAAAAAAVVAAAVVVVVVHGFIEALLGVNFDKRHGLETATREPRTADERQTDAPAK